MKADHPAQEWHTSTKPDHGDIVIAYRPDGKRGQVQIHGNKAMLWRYKLTDEPFCDVADIVRWRGCNGFDF